MELASAHQREARKLPLQRFGLVGLDGLPREQHRLARAHRGLALASGHHLDALAFGERGERGLQLLDLDLEVLDARLELAALFVECRPLIHELHARLVRELVRRELRHLEQVLAHRADGLELAPVAELRLDWRERRFVLAATGRVRDR
jgi:hypothetical protein